MKSDKIEISDNFSFPYKLSSSIYINPLSGSIFFMSFLYKFNYTKLIKEDKGEISLK